MGLNIRIDEKSIQLCDIEKVRKNLEPIIEDPDMVKRFENSVSFVFEPIAPQSPEAYLDLMRRLATPAYKAWFRTLDREIPALPYFLAHHAEGQSTLRVYVMGVLDFRDQHMSIVFDSLAASRFVKEKIHEIKSLCLSHNINPQNAITRLSLIMNAERPAEPAPAPEAAPETPKETAAPPLQAAATATQTAPQAPEQPAEADKPREVAQLKKLLDKYGSLAVFNEGRVTKLFIVFDKMYGRIEFQKNELMIDRTLNSYNFRTTFRLDGEEHAIRSIVLYRIGEVAESIMQHGGVLISVSYRADDGEYQRIFEFDSILPTELVEIKSEQQQAMQQSAASRPPAAPAKPETEVDVLKRENAALKKELADLRSLVDALEAEIKRKGSFGNVLKKMFK